MQVSKTNNAFHFDFTHDGRRVRRIIDCGELAHFLEGGQFHDLSANLGQGKPAVTFYDFIEKFYLPLNSKLNKKATTYKTDQVTMKGLARYFGDTPIHAITSESWEDYKRCRMSGPTPVRCKRIQDELAAPRNRRIIPPDRAASAWTFNRELSGMMQVLDYAARLSYIKKNLLEGTERLPTEGRHEFWLRLNQIEPYLTNIPLRTEETGDPLLYRNFAEFVILTGARVGEALLFSKADVDWARREFKLVTFKKKRKSGSEKVYRYFAIDSLGPRFLSLLKRMKPHPKTGYFFHGQSGRPLSYSFLRTRPMEGARLAGLDWFRLHDSRHTFAMHRAIVVRDFRQLQMELGHEDPMSVQAYLDNTARMSREESIFFVSATAKTPGPLA
jgi:integrase